MINYDAFLIAHQKYSKTDMPFLHELRKTAVQNKTYQGLKILQNIPLTIEAVLKIEPLILGGAEVTVSCIKAVPPQKEALEILEAANIKVIINHSFDESYDFCLDCCGDLVTTVTPRFGTAELTQTGAKIYKDSNPNYPVLSVDDCNLKLLETTFGTADGFLRALRKEVGSEIYNKRFVIFGCGKVGKGIVKALVKVTDNICVVDISEDAWKFAARKGIKAIKGNNIQSVKQAIERTDFIVTATGIKNIISNFYGLSRADCKTAVLTNMGAEDEYGENFRPEDVLFEKKPLNFILSEPTTMKYLDPVLYAHNISVDLILSKKVKAGYNIFPNSLANNILKKWAYLHNENEEAIAEYAL